MDAEVGDPADLVAVPVECAQPNARPPSASATVSPFASRLTIRSSPMLVLPSSGSAVRDAVPPRAGFRTRWAVPRRHRWAPRLRSMKLDVTMRGVALRDAGAWARRAEELGVAGVFTTETNHDPFFPLVMAAAATAAVELGTGYRARLPAQPDAPRAPGVGSPRRERRPVRARPRHAGEGPHRAALQRAVRPPRAAHARADPGRARDLGRVVGRQPSSASRASSSGTR